MSETSRGELAFIDWLRKRTPSTKRVLLGPGDDVAAVAWTDRPCLITADMLLEGSCFVLEGGCVRVPGVEPASPRRVGRKAMAVNLSDLAAMAGIPLAAVVSVGLPKRGGRALAEELYHGLREMADAFDVAIVGGDTNTWDGPLVIDVTVIGEPGPAGIVRRKGAQPGDWLMVTGPLGGSILGKHLDFLPRVREALALAANVTLKAMIDVSDGLASDVAKLCDESECGAILRAEDVPLSDAARQMKDQKTALEHALGDGEDFELAFAVRPEDGQRLLREQPIAGVTLSAVGKCVAERGLWLETEGHRRELPALGWVHEME